MRKKLNSRGLLRHLFLLGVGLALFGIFVYLGGMKSLEQLGALRTMPLVGAFLATLGITGTIASRWRAIGNALGDGRVAAWHDYYHYFIISRALGFFLPKDLTDLGGRSLWLNRLHGQPLTRAGTSVIVDRLFDVLLTSVLLLAVLPYWLGWLQASVGIGLMIGLAILAGVLLIVGHGPLARAVASLLNLVLKGVQRLPWLKKASYDLVDFANLGQGVLLKAYLLSLAKFICTAGRLAFFALALSLPISPALFLFGTPIGQVSYLFAFTPGGLGIFEAGWFGILKLAAVKTEYVAIFVVGQRVFTMVLIVVLALLSQIIYMVRHYFSQSVQSVGKT